MERSLPNVVTPPPYDSVTLHGSVAGNRTAGNNQPWYVPGMCS